MTNHWIDFRNADVVLAIGGNNAENHPISMKWVNEARANGAKYVVVDPRFTRSAAVADIYAPIRSGTDIVFFGALINHILANGLMHEEYVASYTNASWLIAGDYDFDDGMFSGYDSAKRSYDSKKWEYDWESETDWDTAEGAPYAWVNGKGVPDFATPKVKTPKKDPTLKDPRCVFQLMKQHYSRYTPEMVERVCGMPAEKFAEVADVFCATGQPGKAGTALYAMGLTQHTKGSQNIRALSMVQLLLGNMGIAGGGINALRGEANVQGSTDFGLLNHILPGYYSTPLASKHPDLASYLNLETAYAGYWSNKPKFLISQLKEMYGEHATVDNDYLYDHLPKVADKNETFIGVFDAIDNEVVKGLLVWGMNPAVGGPNSIWERQALAKLDWMVAVDLWETDTAQFWKAPGVDSEDVGTEVFLLPAACHYEKQGSIANSGRWIQWRWKAVDPPGEAKDDGEIMDELFRAIRDEYAAGGTFPDPITKLHWDYETDGHFDIEKVARAINGYTVADGGPLPNFTKLTADGSTACGNWIYSGYFNAAGAPAAEQPTGSRVNEDMTVDGLGGGIGSYPKWSFAWPVNRRIIYNRASCDPAGKPYNDDKVLVKWDGTRWVRNDVPDFAFQTAAPEPVPIPPEKTVAFMMNAETVARFFAKGMKDGPFPEHYEPYESPVENALSATRNNPAVKVWESAKLGTADKYPIVMTTFRVVEHWQTGAMTRNMPWLVEAMPKMFVEISNELAEEKGIANGDLVTLSNDRGSIECFAMVTHRLKPFTIDGKTVHQVAAPWHWGYGSKNAKGAIANDLTPNVGCPNTTIPEYKAFLVDLRKGA